MPSVRAVRRAIVVFVINAVVACVIVEGLLVASLHAPRFTGMMPRPYRTLVQQVYRHFNRALIQYEPACAQYDEGVAYTLKPGACTFGNIEFTNQYRINRAGVRDSDAALKAPEVIVLGDSHAMGWGVNQEETLARELERRLGRPVLDAAISSYGTARERMLLDRLDTSRLKVLVIQYSDNDLIENRAFRDNGNRLPIMSRETYDTISRYYAAQRHYYPGKYVFRLLMKVTRLEEPEPDPMKMDPATLPEEAAAFLNVLEHGGRTPLDGVRIVVFEINQQPSPARAFIGALDAARRDERYPVYIRRLATLDTTSVLTPDDFYVLDDHMNARGHRAVGEALAKLIQAN